MFDLDSVPMDRTKKEHVGLLDRVVWCDDDRPVSILVLTDGKSVVVDAASTDFTRGQKYRFLGRWDEGKKGPQFKASTFVRDEPHTRAAVVKYLADVAEGVGAKLANKLWELYGPDAVRVLREEPQRVAGSLVMSLGTAEAAARELKRFAHLEQTRIDLFGLFAGRGFPGKLVERAIAKWGVAAPAVIRRCPFRLLTAHLPGCGWKRCDKLHGDLGKRRDTLKRQSLAGWNALKEDRTGSTWIPAETVVKAITDAVPGAADPVKAVKLGIRGGLLRVHRDGPARWIAVATNARAEQRIADNLARLNTFRALWPHDIDVSSGPGDGKPSTHQAEQILSATRSAVGCFTGGPGTGKTHSLSFVLREVIARYGLDAVAVVAPTGKAAVRATESLTARGITGIRATTIHQFLEIGRNGHDGQGWGFNRNRDNPVSQRFVVMDESSMLDTNIAADFLDAMGDGTHVLFVGDPFQLPPVGHGAPLRDMLRAGIAQGQLTEVRRNAGAIVRACDAIKAGQRPEFCDRFDLDAADPANLLFLECRPADTLDHIEKVLRGVTRFDPVWGAQILVATNDKGDVSRKLVNERMRKVLNPDGRRVSQLPFAVNDKVICLKNSNLRTAAPGAFFLTADELEFSEKYQIAPEATAYVANGEVGRVAAVGPAGMVVSVGTALVWVPKSKPKADADEPADDGAAGGLMGDWDLAYGITTHKSQGGEWPLVIVIADKTGGSVADRNWWYTAISRAKTACLVVGDRAAFHTQCMRQALTQRKTFLTERLAAPAAHS
ncbi:AAA family ATPase [Frigoriglobus tundricola]|uniref:RecD-like DNA helicase YrrC n=1 Tax=Frigoriglobus tundricola TaxID=2774151 RepID=A0A6M5YN14_9BACT|nr:AAA family ATPase [Frigoriglobus tundricola]QJW94736.1 RecD-like DNA helicase YrrC [Frigoriglobus tundricola]